MNPCIFLDRDGVLNEERGEYTFMPGDFRLLPGVAEALKFLKDRKFKIIVITNQSGISKGLYSREQMETCHEILNDQTGGLIDEIYYSPYHPDVTESLSRKPGTLLFERAIARFNADIPRSWMIGDGERDMIPAHRLGIQTIFIGTPERFANAGNFAADLPAAARIIAGIK
jgi:D-glycero-D-manno-heptose 1,7-bisphosphate phosphatase